MSDTVQSNRRTVLKVAATGALAVGTGGVIGSSITPNDYTGKLVFTYDDGPVEDYTKTYAEAHEPEGVPGCTAMIATRVGTTNSLSADQLRELDDAGWEIMSHSYEHRALTNLEVTQDVLVSDQKVYVIDNLHGNHTGDTVRLYDDTKSEVVTVTGKGTAENGQPYITVKEPVTQPFSAGETFERYTDDIIRSELQNSRTRLEEYGVPIDNMVMPYGGFGDRTQEFITEYYTAVPNAEADNRGEVPGDRGLNPVDNLDLPYLSRRYFRENMMTYDEIGTFLDRVRDEDVVGIFGGHSWNQTELPPERIRETIQRAKDRNIEIVTIRQALADLGYTGTTTTTQTTTNDQSTTTTQEQTTTATTTDSTTEATTTTDSTTTADPTTTTEQRTSTTSTTGSTTESTTSTTDSTTATTSTTSTTEPTTSTTESTTTKDSSSSSNSPSNSGSKAYSSGSTTTETTTETTTTTTQEPTTTSTTETTTTETTTTTEPTTTTETTETTTTETPTTTETAGPTSTTRESGGLEINEPGFGWLTAFGAFGSTAAYLLARANDTDSDTATRLDNDEAYQNETDDEE